MSPTSWTNSKNINYFIRGKYLYNFPVIFVFAKKYSVNKEVYVCMTFSVGLPKATPCSFKNYL